MTRKAKSAPRRIGSVLRVLPLVVIMLAIGMLTAFASLSTYEVIVRKDVKYSDVITNVELTSDHDTNVALAGALNKNFAAGSFGIPKKIKLPETSRHLNIVGITSNGSWEASKNLAQTFITTSTRQRMFGQAVVYMRINTVTTSNLGKVLRGDVVNIVTTEGWQLGYKVNEITDDPSKLHIDKNAKLSEIIVIMIDEDTGFRTAFLATLEKVGERV